MIKYYLMRALI